MAGKTKAELVQEAADKGLELTGDETVADLKVLLNEEEPDPIEASGAEVTLDPDQHFFIEGETDPREYPAGEVRSRRLWVEDKNVEHVHDHVSGCWVYRHM